MRRTWLTSALAGVSVLVIVGATVAADGKLERPNFVIILADDLGIECLASYGGKSYETPNLDRLARQGMRFTHCFSNPYCSPSRAELLTGRYPYRNGIKEVLYDFKRHQNLFLDAQREPSFARQLKKAGYRTAIAGKWQLSFLHDRNSINQFGFDEYCCWQIFQPSGTKTTRYHKPHFLRNGKIIAEEIEDQYGPDVLCNFMIDFMKQNKDGPFLAYFTCLLPHFPWVPTPASKDQVVPPGLGDTKFFPDMVRHLDKNVGRIMRALDDQGIAENTVLIFLADNGTDQRMRSVWGDGKIIPGGKGTMTDRGTRVPLIVRWPGKIQPGSTCDDFVDFSDLLPTLCQLSGADLPQQKLNGTSFAPQLLGKPAQPREWVHVQNKTGRHIRNRQWILNNKNQLRAVNKMGEPENPPNQNLDPPKEKAARKTLQAVLDSLTP